MGELVSISFEAQTVSARELHERLRINTRFNDWFARMKEYGFVEGKDFYSNLSKTTEKGGRPSSDYDLTVQMAKELCMIQRTPEAKQIRQYLIQVEESWNKPEMVMARALKMAAGQIDVLKEENQRLIADTERMKPKEVFADAVSASTTSILVRDLAKILRQNGVPTGEKRLYAWMRSHGFIIQNSTHPTQKAMEQGLFEIIESTVQRSDLPPLTTMTTRVTGKGQQYFINRFLGSEA